MRIVQVGSLDSTACPKEIQIVGEIKALLEAGTLDKAKAGKPTDRVEDFLADYLDSHNWHEEWLIDNSVAHNDYAYNKIDWYLDASSCECGNKHRFFLEFFFDNRQAIGSNLLKFEIATQNAKVNGIKTLPIAICGSKEALTKFGWDGGVGSKEEYRAAIAGPYSSVIKNPPLLFSVEI